MSSNREFRVGIGSAIVGLFVLCALLLTVSSAQATVFCVPGYHAGCPDNGSNVAMQNLQGAINTAHSDGVADEILLSAGTHSIAQTLQSNNGADSLLIRGAGRGQTIITSESTENVYVVNLNFPRQVTLSDLQISMPESFPNGPGTGAGLQAGPGTHLERVDIVNNNDATSSAANSWVGSASWHHGRIYSASGEPITCLGFGAFTAQVELRDIVMSDCLPGGLTVEGSNVIVTATNVMITDSASPAVRVQAGAAQVDNLAADITGSSPAVSASATVNSGAPAILKVRHATLKGNLAGVVGESKAASNAVHHASLEVRNSIGWGFVGGYNRNGGGSENNRANLTVTNSNAPGMNVNQNQGDLVLENNFNADPLFVADDSFELSAISPSIDSGQPDPDFPQEDFFGFSRNIDGDRDGLGRPDQGAFEFRPEPNTKLKGGPGKNVKKVAKGKKGKAKFKFSSPDLGATFECRIKKVKAYKQWKSCKSNKTTFKLKPAKKKYVFEVRAVLSGNADKTPASKKFKVTKHR